MNVATHSPILSAAAEWIRQSGGTRSAVIAFVAGVLSVFALAPLFVVPILFVTLPALLWLVEARAGRGDHWELARDNPKALLQLALRGAGIGWWFGFGFHLAGLYWIGYAFMVQADQFAWLLPFAVTLLPAALACFHALAGALTAIALAWYRRNRKIATPEVHHALAPAIVFSLAFAATEWLRGHVLTGFPWNLLGYALAWPLELMQAAGLVGIYGLTLIVPLVFAGPIMVIAGDRLTTASVRIRMVWALGLITIMIGPAWVYGMVQLAQPTPPMAKDIKLRLVQPSIAQTAKWRADKQRQIFNTHILLSETGEDGRPDGLKGITHVIWAEASMPFLPLETPEALSRIGEMLPPGTRLLAGALRRGSDPSGRKRVFNSLVVFGDDGRPEVIYDKIHLVPFGEYLPLGQYLEAVGLRSLVNQRGGFQVGEVPRKVLQIGGLVPMTVLICYEAIFPKAILQTKERPGVLLNVTNDGWFGTSLGPFQHFHQARLRAVEEGLPLVRVANNGLTAVIDSRGRIVRRLNLNEKGVIDSGLPGVGSQPLYAQYGNSMFWALWFICLAILTSLDQFYSNRSFNKQKEGII